MIDIERVRPGDYLISLKDIGRVRKSGRLYKVNRVVGCRFYYYADDGTTPSTFAEKEWSYTIFNNKLNKKLYPNYEEYNGYLIPPKTATKETEK